MLNLIHVIIERCPSYDSVIFSIWTRLNWDRLYVYLIFASINQNKKDIAKKNYFGQFIPVLFEMNNRDVF